MNKILDIAFKDVKHAFRSAFALAFMFVVPILTAGIFFLAFGGMGSGGEETSFSLPQTEVWVVNLDQGSAELDPRRMGMSDEMTEADSMGQVLIQMLAAEGLDEMIDLTVAESPEVARAAVDQQEAGVAVIIPSNFTAAIYDPEGQAEIELYQDPTLTIGPSIVESILGQFVDGFAGTKIALNVALEQVEEADLQLSDGQIQGLVMGYVQRSTGQDSARTMLQVTPPPTEEKQSDASFIEQIIGLNLLGMMIFYAFFTGATSAQTIIEEDEAGTLPRLFSTPTPIATILQGKYLSIGLIVLVQIIVLTLFGKLVFGVQWGALPGVVLAMLGSVLTASTFGIFVISWLKDTRQVGAIYGGVMVITGMLGLLPVFTAGMPMRPAAIEVLALIPPQGWAMRGWRLAMSGASMGEIVLNLGVLVLWSGAFFLIGRARFNRRYA